MPLTILNVAYPLAPVGPDAAGGAEQVLTAIDEALVAGRHRSLVIACAGSVTRGELLPIARARGQLEDAAEQAQRATRAMIAAALDRFRVDAIHLHGVDYHAYVPRTTVPIVVTMHLPASFYPDSVRAAAPRGVVLVAVSESQRARSRGVPFEVVIPNGVPVRGVRMRARKFGYAIALGRICPEKGFHRALDAAKRAGVPLVLAGEVFRYAAHERYFDEQIAPRLDARRRFIGPVGRARKRRLLAGARCLLVPSLVDETSSLVAMEALACGTPVVAFRAGALPEIVEHGRTGFLVGSDDEMARAIAGAGALDRASCRRAAEERFDERRMCAQYMDLYRSVAGAG